MTRKQAHIVYDAITLPALSVLVAVMLVSPDPVVSGGIALCLVLGGLLGLAWVLLRHVACVASCKPFNRKGKNEHR